MKFRSLISMSLLTAWLLAACQGTASPTPTGGVPPIVVDNFAVIAEGRIAPNDSAQLAFGVGGRIAEILVVEGVTVAQGDVIARLDNAQFQAEVARAQTELLNAQQTLKNLQETAALTTAQAQLAVAQGKDALDKAQRRLRNLTSPDITFYTDRVEDAQERVELLTTDAQVTDIQTGKITLDAAKEAVDDASQVLQNVKDIEARYPGCCEDQLKDAQKAANLANDSLQVVELRLSQAQTTNSSSLEDAQEALDDALEDLNNAKSGPTDLRLTLAQADAVMAQASLEDAQRRYEKVKTGPDADQVALAEARIQTAQAALNAAQTALANTELRATIAGTIADIKIKVGETAIPGAPAVSLADFSKWLVETDNLTEIEVVRVAQGQGATIKLDALPDAPLRGKVIEVSSVFEEKRGDVTYTVKIALDDTDPHIRWGMTAEVTFDK